MAGQEITEKNCFSVTWNINHFSYCWQKTGEAIISPTFSVFVPEETKWKLLLYPRGIENGDCVAFCLLREKDCNGSETIETEFYLETLNADGSILIKREAKQTYRKGDCVGVPAFLNRSLLIKYRTIYLPQDILTVRCRIKRFNEKSVEIRQIFARTIINVERRYLLWTIQQFSTLTHGEKKCLVIKSCSNEELLKIDLFLTGGQSFEEKINLTICPIDRSMKYFTLHAALLDAGGMKIDFGRYENLSESSTFPLKLSRNTLMANRDVYLRNNVLSLRLEFAVSTGFSFQGVTMVDFGAISHETTTEVRENWRKCSTEKKATENSCALIADLKTLYEDQTLYDVKLQTKSKVFPVHSTILSARSPVFRAMFSTDMMEKLSGIVEVLDLDDEIVDQFLLYLYTNKLEELKWEDALGLYTVAEKYEITSLKDRCSVFLKGNLDLKNACETLVLSDLHQDEGLKSTVQDFILKHPKDILKSEEWKLLKKTNPNLALETTERNWTKSNC